MGQSHTERTYYAAERAQILYLRHSETAFNETDAICGQVNPPLSEKGELQRQRAVRALVAWKPDRIIASPLERCLGIAEPAARELGICCEVDPRLKELAFGEIEGLTHEEARERGLPSQFDEGWPVRGAESIADFEARVQGAVRELSQTAQGKVAVVAHGGVARPFFSHIFKTRTADIWFNMKLHNVCGVLFSIKDDDRYCLEAFNLTPEEIIARSSGAVDVPVK